MMKENAPETIRQMITQMITNANERCFVELGHKMPEPIISSQINIMYSIYKKGLKDGFDAAIKGIEASKKDIFGMK